MEKARAIKLTEQEAELIVDAMFMERVHINGQLALDTMQGLDDSVAHKAREERYKAFLELGRKIEKLFE